MEDEAVPVDDDASLVLIEQMMSEDAAEGASFDTPRRNPKRIAHARHKNEPDDSLSIGAFSAYLKSVQMNQV